MYWPLVAHGMHDWLVYGPSDGWLNWETAETIFLPGGYAHIYHTSLAILTVPGWTVLISPFAAYSRAHLLAFPDPYVIPKPEAWWIAGPVYLSAGILPFCAIDHLMERMGVTKVRLKIPAFIIIGCAVYMVVLVGHPEDLMAIGAALYSISTAQSGRYKNSGWWLGLALSMQIYTLVLVPLIIVLVRKEHVWSLLWRALLPSILLMIIPLVGDPAATLSLLHRMPDNVKFDLDYRSPTSYIPLGNGNVSWRSAEIILAAILAYWYRAKIRSDFYTVVLVAGISLSLRALEVHCLYYYLIPALLVGILCTYYRRGWQMVLSWFIGGYVIWTFAQYHAPPLERWAMQVSGTIAILLLSYLAERSYKLRQRDHPPVGWGVEEAGDMTRYDAEVL